MATDDKYDRQLRLWGSHGQRLLATSNVLMLNATPATTETLKNLILPAIGSFTVVDGGLVNERDTGNNFFVDAASLGKPRAQVTSDLLKELNPDVHGDYIVQDAGSFIRDKLAEAIKSYKLVVAADLDNTQVLEVSRICMAADVGLVLLRQYGLIGTLRVYRAESAVIESKPDNVMIDDLRLANPFPALREFAMGVKFEEVDSQVHGHIPYNIILIQALQAWKDTHGGQPPKTLAEKNELKAQVKALSHDIGKESNFEEALKNIHKCYQTGALSMRASVRQVLADQKITDPNEKSHYWLLAAALSRFVDKEGALPLSGKLPDMTSTTDFYITLQNIYQDKAHADLEAFTHLLHEVLLERGVFKEAITPEEIKLFCANSQTLEVVRMRSPEDELNAPEWGDFADNFQDAESVWQWFVVTRAVESFRVKHAGRYPGHTTEQIESDFPLLKEEVNAILAQIKPDAKIEDKYIYEIIRFSDAKLHAVGAFLGGVASQEAIKILIKQYTAMNHTFIYDGIHGRCQVFNV